MVAEAVHIQDVILGGIPNLATIRSVNTRNKDITVRHTTGNSADTLRSIVDKGLVTVTSNIGAHEEALKADLRLGICLFHS